MPLDRVARGEEAGVGAVLFESARLDLARLRLASDESLEVALRRATRIGALTLGVARASVWLLDQGDASLRCVSQYLALEERHEHGMVLELAACPSYARAVHAQRAIVASDARNHPDTSELADYLAANGVTSMLDVPIYRDGAVFGVVCCEHVGPPREWSAGEQDFAASLADMLTVLFEQASRIELEARLRQREEKLRELHKMEALGRMARGVAHDFNNVLGTILLSLGSIERAVGDPEKLAEAVVRVRDAAEYGARLTRELLTFSRQAPTKRITSVPMGASLRAMDAMLRTLARERVQLELRAETPTDDLVAIDPIELEQVVVNLTANACDATTEGNVRVTARAAERDDLEQEPGEWLVLEVEDDGVGMDEETQRRLFEPFFTTKASGTGLGLATVYGIVQKAGGRVRVDSAPGRGSRFRVLLPRRVGPAG